MAQTTSFTDLNPDAAVGNAIMLNQQREAAAGGPTAPRLDGSGNVVGFGPESANSGLVGTSDEVTNRNADTGTKVASATTSYDSDAMKKASDDYQAVIGQRMKDLEQQRKDSIMNIENQFSSAKMGQEKAQANEKGATTSALFRAGAYLGVSGSAMGVVNNLASQHRAEVVKLEQARAAAITAANSAYNDKQFEAARAKAQEAKDYEKEIYTRSKDNFEQITKLMDRANKEQEFALEKAKFDFTVDQASNKPVIEASAKSQDFLYDAALKYGIEISPDMTVADASRAIKSSPLYLAEVAQKTKAESGGIVSETDVLSYAKEIMKDQGVSLGQAIETAKQYFAGTAISAPVRNPGEQTILDAARNVTAAGSDADRATLVSAMNQAIERGDYLGATEEIISTIPKYLQGTARDTAFGQTKGIADIDRIENLMALYKAKGGDTGIFDGTVKAITNSVKKSANPELQQIGDQSTLAMIDYRKATSGAAFTESEAKAYKEAFPSTFGSETYNASKFRALRSSFASGLRTIGEMQLGKENYSRVMNMRDALRDQPLLEKKALENGYSPSEVGELILQGMTKQDIEALVSKKADASVTPVSEASGKPGASQLVVSYPGGTKREGGSASWRNNNPLNIKISPFSKQYGAFEGSPATDGGKFAAFPDEATGLKAARDLLRNPNYTKLSLDAAMKRWSGNGYGADVAPPQLRNKNLSQMTDSELTELINAMRKREGWKEGKTYA
jgi:hypothetical protein